MELLMQPVIPLVSGPATAPLPSNETIPIIIIAQGGRLDFSTCTLGMDTSNSSKTSGAPLAKGIPGYYTLGREVFKKIPIKRYTIHQPWKPVFLTHIIKPYTLNATGPNIIDPGTPNFPTAK